MGDLVVKKEIDLIPLVYSPNYAFRAVNPVFLSIFQVLDVVAGSLAWCLEMRTLLQRLFGLWYIF